MGDAPDYADTMAMMRLRLTILLAGFGLLISTGAAVAQSVEEMGYRPVDQTVEDIDPLGVSLRKVDPGLLTVGERTNVYRRIVPGQTPYEQPQSDRLYFVSYGVVAEYDQSQYIYMFDRKGRPAGIAQKIPPNTVFHLGLPEQDVTPTTEPPLNPGQVSGRVNGEVEAAPPAGDDSVSYDRLVQMQRAVVVGALQRAAP